MKKLCMLFVGLVCCRIIFAQVDNAFTSVIPKRVTITKGTGVFKLPNNILIQAPDAAELQQTVAILKDHLTIPTGYMATVNTTKGVMVQVKLVLNKIADNTLGNEG